MLVAVAMPAFHELYQDRRVDEGVGSMLYQVAVRIPLGTVVLEEVAFRGVLPALLAVRIGVMRGCIVASVLFGLWHVLPSLSLNEVNPVATDVFGTGAGGTIAAVVFAVIGTTIAGLWLCWIRYRARSVLATVLAHIGSNSIGYTIAWFVTRRRLNDAVTRPGGSRTRSLVPVLEDRRGAADRDVRQRVRRAHRRPRRHRPAARPRTSSTSATPAGSRTGRSRSREVRAYAHELAWSLVKDFRAKVVVVACNTASAAALDDLREDLPVPVIDVVEPGAQALVRATRSGRIGVIGTVGTINSGAYERAVQSDG